MAARHAVGAVALGFVLCAAVALGGEGGFQSGFGGSFFSTSEPCPLKRFPTFESLIPVPNVVDPFQQDLIPMFCQVRAQNGSNPTKRAKGKFESELVVIDNNTGQSESFPVASGKFRANRDGIANFDFDIPAELFADGFESGDVSAWSYTRTDFTRKKGTNASVSCSTGSSKSGSD